MNAGNYEPPTLQINKRPYWAPEEQLAPGVKGFAYRKGNEIFIPLITAELEASGDVGRFLDSLSKNCVILDVTSERLAGMLRRRGFKEHIRNNRNEWRRS